MDGASHNLRAASSALLVGGLLLLTTAILPRAAGGQEVYRDGERSLSLSLWGQSWYQFVEEGGTPGSEGQDQDLHDYMIRRLYLSVSGTATSSLGFFVHLAGDRLGQQGLDNAGLGLGSGLAIRDGWVSLRLLGRSAQLQVGRMYVPFTRNYGTTSTKALLTTDLNWVQGGYRGGIFYPSTVGRDEGATLWGNVAGGTFQYRLMVADGADDPARNPGDHLRTAGRISLSLFETETGWFNQATSLDGRRVLSVGAGIDRQRIAFQSVDRDYLAWTVDVHLNHPWGDGGLTVNGSYIGISNAPNRVPFTALTPDADGDVLSFQAGYLLPDPVGPGRLQPFGRFEWIGVDGGAPDTRIGGAGLNLHLSGHANKLTVEATLVDQESEIGGASSPGDPLLVTAQFAFGM